MVVSEKYFRIYVGAPKKIVTRNVAVSSESTTLPKMDIQTTRKSSSMNIQTPRKSSSRSITGKNKRMRQINGLYTKVSSDKDADETMAIGRVGNKYALANNKG